MRKRGNFNRVIGNRKKQRGSINEIIHRMVFIIFNKIKQMQGTTHPKRGKSTREGGVDLEGFLLRD